MTRTYSVKVDVTELDNGDLEITLTDPVTGVIVTVDNRSIASAEYRRLIRQILDDFDEKRAHHSAQHPALGGSENV